MVDDSLPHRIACGFVLVRKNAGRLEYLVLRNRGRGDWGLPKGHAEYGESELETARRLARSADLHDPTNAWAQFLLGALATQRGEAQAAIRVW